MYEDTNLPERDVASRNLMQESSHLPGYFTEWIYYYYYLLAEEHKKKLMLVFLITWTD